jgi:excinuclease ABC subunit C
MLFNAERFVDFGPSSLEPVAATPPCQQVHAQRGKPLSGGVRLLCPRNPGVYGMIDGNGELIYVGKAKNLRARLLSYFRARSRDRKAARIVKQARTLAWEVCGSEFAALLRELELIRRWRPRCNVAGQPLRRQKAYVCLGRAPAPYVFLTRRPPASALAVFGPIPAGRRSHDAVCRINDMFGLRDCPQAQEMIFPDEGGLFFEERPPGCLRFEIGSCLGPCTGSCPRTTYNAGVRASRGFLAGTAMGPLEELRAAMTTAAAALEYERAGILRDKLELLSWLTTRLERLRQARTKMSFIYPVAGNTGRCTWYLIHAARTVRAVAAPRDRDSGKQAREAIRAVFWGHAPDLLESHEHVDSMMLVMAWFRKYPEELRKTMTADAALAKCRYLPRSG